uniref:Uncharacterized protein n=1 Tax=Castor canadensis TaxID=51338 RepID=A0A8C0XHD7_CASCN
LNFSSLCSPGLHSQEAGGAGQVGDPKHSPPKAQGGPEAGAGQSRRAGAGGRGAHSQPGHLSSFPPDPLGPQPHAAGCKQRERAADKAKKPKVKKEKKKGKEAPH